MRITGRTADELKLDETPWFPAVIPALFLLLGLFGSVLWLAREEWRNAFVTLGWSAFFLALLYVFARRSQFWADRRAGRAAIRTRDFRGRKEITLALDEIARAEADIRETRHDGHRRVSSRAILVLTDGRRLPLTPLHTTGREGEVLARAINDWLGRTAGTEG